MKYTVSISKAASKEIKRFPRPVISQVFKKIKDLEDNPRPVGCKKLVGVNEELWRVRVGDYRILYAIDDTIRIVDIRKAGHRKDIYE